MFLEIIWLFKFPCLLLDPEILVLKLSFTFLDGHLVFLCEEDNKQTEREIISCVLNGRGGRGLAPLTPGLVMGESGLMGSECWLHWLIRKMREKRRRAWWRGSGVWQVWPDRPHWPWTGIKSSYQCHRSASLWVCSKKVTNLFFIFTWYSSFYVYFCKIFFIF